MTTWFLLGFTGDDVAGAWQHWRLARQCGPALEAEGQSLSFGILESPGQGAHLLYWYVSAAAARLLDAHDVGWRQFLVGSCPGPPAGARPALGPP